jgi:chromosome segregation ATPase
MPQINRIRIINFSYNNNHRNIVDETFDLLQGENALFNLKNGGGKSVLVQLLLQPIIPKTKLMSRRIEDFFKGKKTPSYIMIEWKLEDQGGYLLTGIALTNKESQVREQDDANNSIKYYTFTSAYRESNAFDIKNIPLIKQQNEKIYIEDFKDARKQIIAKEKETGAVRLFSDEDGADYRRHLESFNIFQDEWKSIILKINESEGGVIEIFEKCKTSQQLMNDWILKSVEKVVTNEDKDQKKLEQMLENLVEEMISNEQFIYEKDLYTDFLRQSNDFLNKLEELVQSIDKENQLEGYIAKLYYFLKSEINKMTAEIEQQNELISSSQEEVKRIDLEERSKAYYDELENVTRWTESLSEVNNELNIINERIERSSKEVKVQQAARDYRQIKGLEGKIAGIMAEIEKVKFNGNHDEKIKNLEYSLKLAYEKALSELKVKVLKINTDVEKNMAAIKDFNDKLDELDRENNDLSVKKGIVISKIEQFEKNENKIRKELGLTYERNLLGEIEQIYFDEFFRSLDEGMQELIGERKSNFHEIERLGQLSVSFKEKMDSLREAERDFVIEETKLGSSIDTYNLLEESLKPVFERYDIHFSKRFHYQENLLMVDKHVHELEKIERDSALNSHTIKENIASLKEGTLHVSKEFSQWLVNQDIEFETGEKYLRKQPAHIRESLVQQNPILPFSFLLYDEDIERLKTMEISCKTHQMVPILSYGNINETFIVEGQSVHIKERLQLLCLYDQRMIDADNLDGYLAELQEEWNQLNEKLIHYRQQLEVVREDFRLLKQFDFDKDYLYELEGKKKKILEQIDFVKEEIKSLDEEQSKVAENQRQLSERNVTLDRLLEKKAERKIKAQELIKENEEYIENKQFEREISVSNTRISKEKTAINGEVFRLSKEKDDLIEQRSQVKNTVEGKKRNYELYKNAHKAVVLDQDIEEMEGQLQALKSEVTWALERLEGDLQEKRSELKDKQESLASYQLEVSEYIDMVFDAVKLSELQQEVGELVKKQKKLNQSYLEVNGALRKAEGLLISAEKEVKNLAEVPLEQSLIKLNFEIRRKEEKNKKEDATNTINKLRSDSKRYEKVTNKIEEKIDVSKHEVNTNYVMKENVDQDYQTINKELNQLKEENNSSEKNLGRNYDQLKIKFGNKNNHIENILAGLDILIDGAQSDKDKYYYLGERLLLSNESLRKLIKACEERLSNVEKNKHDMIQHSYLHAKQVFGEIQKIAENSSIKLDGKNRPIPMLKINMEPLSETEEENITKMRAYIENCVSIIKKDMKEDKRLEEIHKKISKYMSTKELLNVLSDLGKLKIMAYKIDINVNNSGYKSWEQVMKENSGGERFVSFFAVLVALMSYTRTSMKFEDDYQRNTDTKVLIMDNPFGPISSEHLLKPLFKIAQKYNTQLICLTDLKQNSILNCFNLIYMIKIRQNVFGTNEYIQLEQQIKEDAQVERDEMLEKAVFRASEIEQISLF